MTEILKVNNEILENPRNYAAIYARVSSAKDNNSIKAQIEKAKFILNERNLLVYAVYTDHVSGRTTPPPARAGFSKLLADANAGRFKTLIVYKHDRIARNLKDWIELKNELKKIKVNIIFSAETEYISDNSIQGDFLENLMVMVAELEPNTINERSSNGRNFRRLQGVYNSASNIPFAYIREKITPFNNNLKENNVSNIKSFFKKKSLEAAFVEYLFNYFNKAIENNDTKTTLKNLQKDSLEFLDEIILNLSFENLDNLEKIYSGSIKLNLISELKSKLKVKDEIGDINQALEYIKKRISKIANIENILKNDTYGGYQLKDARDKTLGIILDKNSTRLNFNSFEKLINVEGPIVDKDTFEKVYCHMYLPTLLKQKEPDFLLKGKLVCGHCKRKMHLHEHLLKCTDKNRQNKCMSYVKTNLIESILDVIIDDAFMQSDTGFKKFLASIDEKLVRYNAELQKLRNLKMHMLKDYLNSKNQKYIDAINYKQKEINELLQKIAALQERLYTIKTLEKNITSNYFDRKAIVKTSEHLITFIKAQIIDYIINNENIFNSLFEKIIKTVEVKTIESKDSNKCSLSINYEFVYKKHSDIFESIN